EEAEWCNIQPVIETVTDRNARDLLRDVDLVFDGLDNFRTRYILNQFAVMSETPYLFASAIADQAHIALLNPTNTACLECIMPLKDLTIELSKIGNGIPPDKILLSTASVLVYRHGEFTVSLFRNGRFLIGGVENEIQAARMAREISQHVGLET